MSRIRLLAVAGVAVAALGILAASGLGDSLVYYQTPSEVGADTPADATIRLGGLVRTGSVQPAGDGIRFVLTDGAANVEVLHRSEVRGVFQEGQGALVEGRLGPDGVFRSELVMVRHDNEYRAVDDARAVEQDQEAGR